ncbi:class I SAM-dependent methyltransferase [Chengkuizengella sediminis]|uniref:class I SAM-dependent methyltransferase n=1 Tax=Chengkuizengella sediminis TaxID=1885917 RepID=UPI00138A15B4|nr:class I SAM-dependent methyltransferase [Chengkuizengella sediminis]NDI36236.1 class I SAM-dependent methyltransferase [Chengkuizengella sediminis]
MKKLTEHWNGIYKKTEDENLGWYEEGFSQTLKILNLIPTWKESKMFVSGVGTSGLVDELLQSKADLVLNDLSSEAIEKLKLKYMDMGNRIEWLCQDISEPLPTDLKEIDIWIDRAVLHFLTDDVSIGQYFKNVTTSLNVGGYAIFAEFSKKGATKCAGLDVRRYDIQDLKEYLPSFECIAEEEYTFINPKGDTRPYIYALFSKIK